MALEVAHTKHPHVEEPIPPLSPRQREAVNRALEDVLASASMRATLQCQTLLQYITEHTLSGELSLLRERVIGKEVFGRKADYEPGEDPVVRIRAADLRKRLALYYQSLHTIPDVRIDVPSGSYRATFTWKSDEPGPAVLPVEPVHESPDALPVSFLQHPEVTVPPSDTRPGLMRLRFVAYLALAFMLFGCLYTGAAWYRDRPERLLRTFWRPILDSPKPVLISIGSNAVYRVSDEKADAYSRQNHLESSGMESFQNFAPETTIASSGLHPAENSFVALGDVAAVSEMVATLAHLNKGYQERFPNDVSFAEVRNNPTLLIGGFNNPMTRELTRNFRFVLASRNRIEDHSEPGKAWVLHASSDSHDTEDYAIITRVLRHEEDEPMVSVAGMGQYGTLAATHFVCKPESIAQLDAALGNEWRKKNFQAVLRIKIIDFKPVSTSILATHTW